VWCADITYIPMAKGFLYLVAVRDWFSRRVLAWRVSMLAPVRIRSYLPLRLTRGIRLPDEVGAWF
jgi:transposase InsO family protein